MLNLQITPEILKELHSTATDFGFTSPEDFVCYVIKELLDLIKDGDVDVGEQTISKQEEDEMKAKLKSLGYM
ncbi:MAG TPA: hypothetical protein HPP87_08965 [Planctomycetes bacterium]|nr:hypothetical protein [Planctomycetota bacterium]